MSEPFKGKPPRLSHIFQIYDPPLYFVTFCTRDRRRVLDSDAVHEAFRRYAERGAAEHNVAVGRYVIMPDHVHLFVRGGDKFSLGLWVRGLKRAIGKAVVEASVSDASGVEAAVPAAKSSTNAAETAASTTLWQPGFFDHLLRNSESYAGKWHYVRDNPVRGGLVQRVEDWPYQGEVVTIDRV